MSRKGESEVNYFIQRREYPQEMYGNVCLGPAVTTLLLGGQDHLKLTSKEPEVVPP